MSRPSYAAASCQNSSDYSAKRACFPVNTPRARAERPGLKRARFSQSRLCCCCCAWQHALVTSLEKSKRCETWPVALPAPTGWMFWERGRAGTKETTTPSARWRRMLILLHNLWTSDTIFTLAFTSVISFFKWMAGFGEETFRCDWHKWAEIDPQAPFSMLVSIKSIGKGSVPVRQTLFSYETIRTAQFNHLSPKAPVHPSNNPSGRNHNTAKRNPEITRSCKPDTRETKQRNNGSAQDGANILWPNWQSSACFIDFSKEFLLD